MRGVQVIASPPAAGFRSTACAVGIGLCALLLAACGDQADPEKLDAAAASPTAACSGDVAPIEENPAFTPYEQRLSHSPFEEARWRVPPLSEPAVLPSDVEAEVALGGLPAVAAEVIADDFYTLAYGEHPPDGSQSEFLKSGGLVLEVTPGDPGETSIARSLYAESGDGQIVLVEVGEYEAALSWADPDQNGVREHHVLWTDTLGRDVNLYGVRDAEELVAIARSIACE